jgi:hypothetical protein
MTGEKYDETFSLNRFGDKRDQESAYLMGATLCWLAVYYIVLRPLQLVSTTPNSFLLNKYEEAGLKSRFGYFKNWRQYEYMHIVCWLAKDFSWMISSKPLWILFTIPTLAVAFDFVYVTGKIKV